MVSAVFNIPALVLEPSIPLVTLGTVTGWNVAVWTTSAVLVGAAVVSAMIIGRQARALTAMELDSEPILNQFRDLSEPLEAYGKGSGSENGPAERIYRVGAQEIVRLLMGSAEVDATFMERLQDAQPLAPSQLEPIRIAMRHVLRTEVFPPLRGNIGRLALIAQGAPWLGLVGSFLGVVGALRGAELRQPEMTFFGLSPDLALALVPGMIGLIVAGGSLLGHNALVRRSAALADRLKDFAELFLAGCSTHYVDHRMGMGSTRGESTPAVPSSEMPVPVEHVPVEHEGFPVLSAFSDESATPTSGGALELVPGATIEALAGSFAPPATPDKSRAAARTVQIFEFPAPLPEPPQPPKPAGIPTIPTLEPPARPMDTSPLGAESRLSP